MSLPPAETLTAPIADRDDPCGHDLEYDPRFQALELAAKPRPEHQMGDATIEGGGPDWREARRIALELFGETRDLRIAVYLVRSVVETDGWRGVAQALAALRGLVVDHWENVHPRLDPDDGNDPTMRINVLQRLCDRESTLADLRNAPLVELRGVGAFSFRDVELASGQATPRADEKPPTSSLIDGAFVDCDVDELRERADAVRSALEHWRAIDASLTDRLGSSGAPDLSALEDLLATIAQLLDERLARRGVGDAPVAETNHVAAVESDGQPAATQTRPAAAAPATSGPPSVESPSDVVRALDLICDYYARKEPSSPVPMLCQRAKRLVSKDFFDVLRDLVPDAIDQAEVYRGSRNDDDD